MALVCYIYLIIVYYVKINIEDVVNNEIHCERIQSLNMKWMKTHIL